MNRFHMARALLLVVSMAASAATLAAPAGRVLVAVGEVTAVRAGTAVRLEKDSAVESGDTIVTGTTSNVQLRLTDGAVIALRPDTRFVIENYNFRPDDAEGKDDRGVFNLIKGGLRTLSGLVGKRERESYQMKTTTATIGIRGTHYNLVLCQQNCRNADGSLSRDGLFGTVLDGAIAVKNEKHESVFGKDDVFFVLDTASAPEKLLAPPPFLRDRLDGQARSKKGDKQSEQTEQARTKDEGGDGKQETAQEVKSGNPPRAEPSSLLASALAWAMQFLPTTENRNTNGGLIALPVTTATLGQTDSVAPPAGSLFASSAAAVPNTSFGNHTAEVDGAATITYDASGLATMTFGGGTCTGGYICRGTAQNKEYGADGGVIIWGRWASGQITAGGWYNNLNFSSLQGLHYVVGNKTTIMPTSGTAVYTAIGATQVTYSAPGASNALGLGTVTGGTLTANFTTNSVTSSFDYTFANGSQYHTALSGSGSGGQISASGTTSFVGGATNVCAPAGCSTSAVGLFAGTGASHAGIVFDASATGGYYLNGAVVFKK